MEEFIKHFRREGAGEWVCLSPTTVNTHKGRVQVTAGSRFTLGRPFMNVDVAEILEHAYQRSSAGR